MAEMLSPGVFTTEIDASTIAPTVSNSIGVFAGQFEKGPVGDYLLITTVDELIEYYGLPTNSNYNDWYQAYNFLQYGNKLYISRAVDSATSTNAVAEVAVDGGTETTDVELESNVAMIGNADEYETAEASIPFSGDEAKLKFIAKNPGSWGNDVEIAIANPDAFDDEQPSLAFEGIPLNDLFEYYPTGTQVGIVIRYGNEIKEVFTVDMDPSAKDQNNKSNYIETVINAQSNYVYVKDNTAIAGAPANYLYQHSSVGVEEEPFGPIQLTPPSTPPHQLFGRAVAVEGTRLVVGAIHESSPDSAGGIVYIYEWNGSSYDEVATLTDSDLSEYDEFGASVALDGTRLVVGSPLEDTTGKVYIYDWNGTSYVEVGTLTASDAEVNDRFGFSVALDGTRLVVGAWGEDTGGPEAGKVYIYEWNGTSYNEVGTLTASDAEAGDMFGTDVAVDGTRLVVGAPYEDTAGTTAGKVYIYNWNGTTSTYDEVGTLTASDAEAEDWFGFSVALDGTTLVVGAYQEDTAGNRAGKVYIYDWNSATSTYDEISTVTASDAETEGLFWSSVSVDGARIALGAVGADAMAGKVYVYYFDGTIYDPFEPQPEEPDPFEPLQLTASDAEAADRFGAAVAVDGTRLVVGAHYEDTAGNDAGKVYIYDWNGTTYDEVSTLVASDAQAGDRFGQSVALDGTRLVVGVSNKDIVTNNEGKVYIYEWNGTTYDEVATLTASDADESDYFGSSVALDGTRLVVGARVEDTAGDAAGKVYIYDWNGTSYVEVGTVTASDAESGDNFGSSVALDGTRLVVGAYEEDTAALNAGKVYIYDWNGTNYNQVGTLTASDAQIADFFGTSVALSGTRLVVGAYDEDTAGDGAGKVYIYEWNGTSYDEVGTLTASDAEKHDWFGTSVALDGTRLVVGAYQEDTAASNAGKVYIYELE